MALITRQGKGSKLSIEDMDGNLQHLDSQASKWENETKPATKAALASELHGELIDGIVLTIGDISYEFDTDGIWDPSNYRVDLTDLTDESITDLINYNNTNNVAQIMADDRFLIVANEAGAAGNNIFVSISGTDHTYYEYDPETDTIGAELPGVQGDTTLRGGSDETASEIYIKPKNNKKIDASIIENLVESTSIEGTHYLYVAGKGTPTENATELQNAYDTAKTLTPNGNPLAADNRVKIIVGTGKYEFPNSSPFTLDTQYIDIVSLTGDADVFLYTTNANDKVTIQDNIIVNTNNIFIKGIDASTEVWLSKEFKSGGKFHITDYLENLALENCTGGEGSFGSNGTASGTFTNCTGGVGSFGGKLTGTLKFCTLTTGTFPVPSGDGAIYYSIDNSNVPEVPATGTITISPETQEFAAAGESKDITVTASSAYEIVSKPDWITGVIDGKTTKFTAAANSGAALTGNVVFALTGDASVKVKLEVTQLAGGE